MNNRVYRIRGFDGAKKKEMRVGIKLFSSLSKTEDLAGSSILVTCILD